jgi:hypothetical protein
VLQTSGQFTDIKSPANVKSIEIIIIDDRFAAKIEGKFDLGNASNG